MRRRTTTPARRSRPFATVVEPLEGRRLLATTLVQAVQPPPTIITAYPLPSTQVVASSITTGPDSNLWFLEDSSGNSKVGRITTDGALKEFPIPDGFYFSPAHRLTAGPDGALWFTGIHDAIGRITTDGVVSVFPLPRYQGTGAVTGGYASDITAGPDGNLWFTQGDANQIGRITPGGVVTEFPILSSAKVYGGGIPENPPNYIFSSEPVGIAAGPDGNLWFTESAANQIGRITPGGVVTEFALPGPGRSPGEIAAGPDGNLSYTELDASHSGGPFGRIGRITTAGVATEFTPPSSPHEIHSIAAGSDGNVYFTEADFPGSPPTSGSGIGGITPAGTIFEVPGVSPQNVPLGITGGPDGNIWYTQLLSPTISRLSLPSATIRPTTPTPIAPAPFVAPFATTTTPGLHAAAGPFAPFDQATGGSTSHASSSVAKNRHYGRHVASHHPRIHGQPHPRFIGAGGPGRSMLGGAKVRHAHERG